MEVLPSNNEKGIITAYTGPMFSGKSGRLVTDYRRSRFGRQYSLLFKPAIDTRYSTSALATHDKLEENCIQAANSTDLRTAYDSSLERIVGTITKDAIKTGKFALKFTDEGIEYRRDPRGVKVENVFIDEAQFFDSGIKDFIRHITGLGTDVYLAFLTQTSGGRAFPFADSKGNVTELLEMADFLQSFSAVCYNCGSVATKTYKLQSTGSTVEVGGADLYRAACVDCWEPRE